MTTPNDGSFEWRSCLKKRKYAGQEQVERIIEASRKKTGKRLYAYCCTFCHCWHLTHRKQRTNSHARAPLVSQ